MRKFALSFIALVLIPTAIFFHSNIATWAQDVNKATYDALTVTNWMIVGGTGTQPTILRGPVELQGTTTVKGGTLNFTAPTDGSAVPATLIVPKVGFASVLGATTTNPGGFTLRLMDATPTGEWTATDANDVTVTADSAVVRKSAASLKAVFSTAADPNDGVTATRSSEVWTADENVGFWIRLNRVLAAGDLMFVINNNGANQAGINVPALAVANTWYWVKIALAGTRADVDGITILLSNAGATKAAASAITVNLDWMWKWDTDDEMALGIDALEVPPLYAIKRATAAATINDGTTLVEGTDYFLDWRTGNDYMVLITDQDANAIEALFALK